MNARRLSLLIGAVTLAVGVVAIVAPGVVPVSPDRAIVSLVGALAILQALRVVQRRRGGTLDEATTPDPERAVSTPRPGEDVESVLGEFLDRRRVYGHLSRIREGLIAAAVAVLAQFEGHTPSDARARVAAGTWTDDAYAASFLGGEEAPRVPLRARLGHTLARESSRRRKIRRTVDAIAAVVERHVGRNGGVANDPRTRERDDRTTRDAGAGRRASTAEPSAFEEGTDEVVARSAHPTGHWRGVSVVALVGIGVGVVVEQPSVLLAGVVGIGYAAYARSSSLPPGPVAIDRTLDTETPESGEAVTVTVTVTNTGDRVLPDLRVVDGVPEALSVAEGSPRCGAALRPTASTSFTYTVTARRGVHEFGSTQVIGRDLTGGTEEERLYASETTLTCVPSLSAGTEPMPLRRRATRFVGRERAPTTGDGIEFSSVREYRPGDPMGRIDWNRHARTRTLTTVEFREERAATVVLLIDARPAAYVSPDSGATHAVDRSVDAAGQLFAWLADSGNRVGIAVAGSDSCWLAPDAGVDHRARARELLALEPALSPVPNDERTVSWRWQRTLRKRLEPGTQLVFLSPLCDRATTRIARQFDEQGVPVTVLSPDPTGGQSPGHRLAGVARQLRVSRLRGAGVPVIDWPWATSLDAALARTNDRRAE